MRILSLSAVSTGSEEGASAPFSFLLDLPAICMKCFQRIGNLEGYCDFCFVEEEPDFDLIFRDDK
jgi:hypothetical protein